MLEKKKLIEAQLEEPRRPKGSSYLDGPKVSQIWMCSNGSQVEGPQSPCPDGQPPKSQGLQPHVTGEPAAAQNYRKQVQAPEYVGKGTSIFGKNIFDLKKYSQVPPPPPEGGAGGGIDLGGLGGPPGGEEKKGLPPRPKEKRIHLSDEFSMMTDPDLDEGDGNSDIKSITRSCEDLEIDS